MTKNPSAQDILQKSRPLLGSLTTFRSTYPQVSKLHVEVRANPMGFGKVETYVYSLDNQPGQYCPCANPHCTAGGFDVGYFLYDLISNKQTNGETGGACRGHERMNRRDSRACYYSFQAKADISYAE